MTHPSAILLVESNVSDRTLSTLLLERALPQAAIAVAPDALAFAEALIASTPDVAVVAADLSWTTAKDVIAAIKRRSPTTAIVLFGHEPDVARALDPGLACDGLVHKGSGGFLGLAPVITEVFARSGRSASATATDTAPPMAVGGTDHEMRDLALVFSHDLQEPLQQIARLAQRAQAAEIDPASGRTLQQVLECAERANNMLERIVEYLSVTGRDATSAPVDLNACLSHALTNLDSAIDESGAEIRAVSLPMSVGDEHQFLHVFQNLVSNAIKFRSRERPVITISVEPRGTQWLLAFRDNGIGIPQAFTERIFEFGKRLHTREEYPGTGIGLALCRRIVERHGGRIWGESREGGGGATFYVLLPRAPVDVARLA